MKWIGYLPRSASPFYCTAFHKIWSYLACLDAPGRCCASISIAPSSLCARGDSSVGAMPAVVSACAASSSVDLQIQVGERQPSSRAYVRMSLCSVVSKP